MVISYILNNVGVIIEINGELLMFSFLIKLNNQFHIGISYSGRIDQIKIHLRDALQSTEANGTTVVNNMRNQQAEIIRPTDGDVWSGGKEMCTKKIEIRVSKHILPK